MDLGSNIMAFKTTENEKQIIVIDVNGNLKLASPGDSIFPGEVSLNKELGELLVEVVDLPEESDDITAILDAILDGQDPSLITEAPAAGESGGSSLTASTEIERVGRSSIAETNFDTSSLQSIGLSETQSLTLLEQYKVYRETGELVVPEQNNVIGSLSDVNVLDNSVSENAIVGDVVNITGQAIDPDSDEVTYRLSDDADGLFQIDPITGVVTVARDGLDFESATSHEIVIVATSTDGSSSEETFVIGVENVDGTTPGQGDTDNDIGAVTDSDGSENTISENAVVGDVVNITGQAVDPDGDEVTYSLSDDANGLFQIDPITGVVTVARDGLDFESETSHEIVIVATSTDGSSSEETFIIGVENADGTTPGQGDTDNDIGAVTDSDGGANTVSENAAVGDVVNIIGQAVDPDGDEVTYSLSDDANGLFQIDPITGVVTVARDGLDFESATSHEVVIVATSTDGSSSEETFVIGVENADDTTTPPEPENNDVGAVTDSDGGANTVSENAAVGDVVNITGQAVDPDGDEVTYSLSDDADGLFQIDPITGVVTVARDGLDFESATSHEIVIVATSTDGSSSEETFVIGVENADGTTPGQGDTDNDIGAVTDSDGGANSVSENAIVGDVVNITGQAIDPDSDEVTYRLSDDADGLFQIDPITGVVTVARDGLDFESATSHEIVIVATSTDGSSSEETFVIGVENVDGTTPPPEPENNDVGVVTDSDGGVNTVSENAAVGDVVNITGQAVDPDGDEVTYSLSDDADGLFQIDPITGVVTVARDGLDFESATSHEIVIVATSTDGSSSEETFVIGVENEDDTTTPPEPENNDVGVVTDSDGGVNTVSENAAVGDVVNITGQAVDPDGDEVTYSLSDDADGLFQIDPITGVVTVARDGLDFESATSHEIVIVATSTDGSSSEETFVIGVENADGGELVVPEQNNVIGSLSDVNVLDNSVSENAIVGDVVNITGQAIDPDSDEVTYRLSDDADGLFQIDPITGVVTVARDGLDFESATSHEIVIVATSSDGSSSEETFVIGVENEDDTTTPPEPENNDVGVVTDSDGGVNTVSENAAVGDVVNITGQAVDPDGDEVTYSLSDDADGLFQIDPITGVVTVARDGLDFESATSHEIVIVATSTDGSSSEETFVIGVENEDDTTTPPEPENNDVGVVTDSDGGVNTVSENAAVGDVVNITGQAVDPDGDEVTYSLSDDADGLFQIDPITGVVTVARDGLDFESATSHEIVIVATSTDGSSSEETFVIGVENADGTTPGQGDTDNDIGAVTDSDGGANTVSENAAVGDVVNIIGQAVDPDGDEVTYSLSDDANGLFQIDPITGVVTVARDGLDFESATSHEVVIVATSTDGSSSEETFVIGVENEDDTTTPPEPENNDVGVVTDSDGGVNTVSENAAVGDVVNITGQAVDPDGDEVTYSLSDDADGLFQIDPITGVVTVARDGLDFESATSHEIVIVATSSDGSSSEETFVIGVENEDDTTTPPEPENNDVGVVTDSDGGVNTVSENAAVGDVVNITGQAVDPDGDEVTYSLSDDADGLFQIDPITGVVTVARDGLDFESATSHEIVIVATSTDGSSSEETFVIGVENADGTTPGQGDTDNDIGAVTDSDGGVNTVSENAAVGDVVNITGQAVDPDGDEVTYSLSDDADGLFQIDPITGVVTVARDGLDFESATSHEIVIVAISSDGSSSEETFVIGVEADTTVPNVDPIADDFKIMLNDETSTQFTFEPHVSDIEDDADANDDKTIDIGITDLPELGTLYLVEGDTRTEITTSTVLTENSQIEYVLNDTVHEDLSFNATDDFLPNYTDGSVSSFTLTSGVIISGGTYTGDSPDAESTLTAGDLFYDDRTGETGLGVGDSELDVDDQDYIEVDFSQVGASESTNIAVTEVNIDFGSIWAHYEDDHGANAEIQVLLFKDGQVVGESPYVFDDSTNSDVYDGSGEFTANIQLDSGFDQIRVYTVHGDGSTVSNSNITLQGVEVVAVSEDIHYKATDSDGGTDPGIITLSSKNSGESKNTDPIANDTEINNAVEDTKILLSTSDFNVSDSDNDTLIFTSTSNLTSGSASINSDGDIEFTPAPDFSGEVTFDYTISDGKGGEATATATIKISAVADIPTLSVIQSSNWIFTSSFEDQPGDDGKKFSSSVDGWTPIAGEGAVETWETGESMSDAGSISASDGNQFLELDSASSFDSTKGVERSIDTQEGKLYTLTLDVAPRPGYDKEYNSFDIVVDGVVVGSWEGSSSPKDQSLEWSTIQVSFYGSSTSQNIQLISTGKHHESGRGALIDNLVIEDHNGVQAGNQEAKTHIDLNDYISGSLTDTDNSEVLSYEIANLPADASIYVNDVYISVTDGKVTLTAEQLSTGKIVFDSSYTGAFTLAVTAIATEISNGDTARSEPQFLDLVVTGKGLVTNPIESTTVQGGDFADQITKGSVQSITPEVNGQTFVIADANNINSGAGNDHVASGSGNDIIHLGDSHTAGYDETQSAYDIADEERALFAKGSDASKLNAQDLDSFISGYSPVAHIDAAHAGAGDDHVFGEGGIDLIYGAEGNDYLDGGEGDDVLRGGSGNDILIGGSGNDILIGGLGNDILTGGTGEDIFKWVDQGADSGLDTIKDFTKGEDLIDLTEILTDDVNQTNVDALLAHIELSESGNDLTLLITDDAGNKHTITVEGGINSFGLESADFNNNQSEILTQLLENQMFKVDV
ncbi:hemolysin-type calcium-binding protein [Aliivibrio wodanis]|uniref:Hemolysin-type calcium-binding protein n=1 Tax=Aliivibrio wodanis TaxID=80852 RepID=A0A090I8E4_9GAMM|nr:hemolysin-type calcium-binding protein [Aliivibrio wodanis]